MVASKSRAPLVKDRIAETYNGDKKAVTDAERKRKHNIGSVAYTIFVLLHTLLLLCAVLNPQSLPLESLRKFEVLPKTYDEMKLFWASFSMFDPILYGLIYLLITFGGYNLMLKREPWKLVWFQRCWNIAIAIFSIWCSIRTCSLIVKWISRDGTIMTMRPLTEIICDGSIGNVFLDQSPMAFYTVIFIFSKYFEFMDTFFLIMRKKQLITLHWWHHFSVSVFCMYGGMSQISITMFGAVLNYFVHGYMYTYYAFASFGYRPSIWARPITVLQLTQFIVGLMIACVAVYAKYNRPKCIWQNPSADGMYMLAMTFFIYGSYFLLFAQFYFGRYIRPKKLKSS